MQLSFTVGFCKLCVLKGDNRLLALPPAYLAHNCPSVWVKGRAVMVRHNRQQHVQSTLKPFYICGTGDQLVNIGADKALNN